MTSDKTIAKADIMLETLLEYDQKDPNCTVRKALQEIVSKWGNNDI